MPKKKQSEGIDKKAVERLLHKVYDTIYDAEVHCKRAMDTLTYVEELLNKKE